MISSAILLKTAVSYFTFLIIDERPCSYAKRPKSKRGRPCYRPTALPITLMVNSSKHSPLTLYMISSHPKKHFIMTPLKILTESCSGSYLILFYVIFFSWSSWSSHLWQMHDILGCFLWGVRIWRPWIWSFACFPMFLPNWTEARHQKLLLYLWLNILTFCIWVQFSMTRILSLHLA